jgi:hypothetical protein
MAPAVRQHPEAWTTRGDLVITESLAYVLCRIEDDSSLTPISEHENVADGGRRRLGVDHVGECGQIEAAVLGEPPAYARRGERCLESRT